MNQIKKIKAIKDEDDQRLLEFLDLMEKTQRILMNGKWWRIAKYKSNKHYWGKFSRNNSSNWGLENQWRRQQGQRIK